MLAPRLCGGSAMLHGARTILGVKANASPQEVKHAFRRRALETHPDKGGSEDTFRAVRQAYELLTNPANATASLFVPPRPQPRPTPSSPQVPVRPRQPASPTPAPATPPSSRPQRRPRTLTEEIDMAFANLPRFVASSLKSQVVRPPAAKSAKSAGAGSSPPGSKAGAKGAAKAASPKGAAKAKATTGAGGAAAKPKAKSAAAQRPGAAKRPRSASDSGSSDSSSGSDSSSYSYSSDEEAAPARDSVQPPPAKRRPSGGAGAASSAAPSPPVGAPSGATAGAPAEAAKAPCRRQAPAPETPARSEAPPAPPPQAAGSERAVDIATLAARIRATPVERRRGLLEALTEATREALYAHLTKERAAAAAAAAPRDTRTSPPAPDLVAATPAKKRLRHTSGARGSWRVTQVASISPPRAEGAC